MKTIIISDVNSKSDSVIPYGLRLARSLETEADVLHIIDTRVEQGNYSSFSDSQSITPGSTFLTDESINKEKILAEKKLDDLLSSEASRLNYPLKVKRLIEVGSVEEIIAEKAEKNPQAVFVISSEPDGFIFQSAGEILDIIEDTGAISIIVSPGKEFIDYRNILLPTDFAPEELTAFKEVKFLPENFKLLVDATAVATKDNYADLEMKGKAWKKEAEKIMDPATLKTNTLEGENSFSAIENYMNRNLWDLVLFIQDKKSSAKRLFEQDDMESFIEIAKIPILIYYYNNK